MVDYNADDIKEVMEITGLSADKAETLFRQVANDIDDGSDDELCSYDIIDVIKMEHKVKENKTDKHYEKSEEKKERKPREKKIDDEKKSIIEIIHKALVENGYNAVISNIDKTIDFGVYTVNLTKHRPKKADST